MLPLPSKVMIVEDEMLAQRHIRNILKSLDVEVAGCFDNAADARAALTQDLCDMILMDINIKGPEDGIQFSRSLLQQYDLPIVFISAYSDGETLEEVLELSPYGFITKPFSAKDVEVAMGIAYRRFHADGTKRAMAAATAPTALQADTVQIDELYRFDVRAQILYRQDESVRLNKKQLKLISTLAQHCDQIVDYNTLIDEVWPDGVLADSSLRTLIYSVRQLLPDFPIESHSKMGYAIKSSASF
jgi:DNA-binding response OmpR family regulator